MAEFTWHKMTEEEPPESVKDYVVMGHNGGLIIANVYGYSRFAGCKEFIRCGSENTYIPLDEVYAWAEIPPLEEHER